MTNPCDPFVFLSDLNVWDVQTARGNVRGDEHGVDAFAEALQVLFSLVLCVHEVTEIEKTTKGAARKKIRWIHI